MFAFTFTHWEVIFIVLLAEAFICLLLTMPLPTRFKRGILLGMSVIWRNPITRTISLVNFVILLALFVSSLMDTSHLSQEVMAGGSSSMGTNSQSRILHAQRNAYLSGFTLFLMLILYRFQHMIGDLFKMEKQLQDFQVHLAEQGLPTKLPEDTIKQKEEIDTLKKAVSEAEQHVEAKQQEYAKMVEVAKGIPEKQVEA